MSSTSVARPTYAVVLRIPHARRTFAAALLGRLSYGIVPLSVMLAVNRASGSYAVAGTVMALFGGTSVFLSPARAALIDRYGPRRTLVPMVAAYAALLGLLTLLVRRPGAVSPLVLGAVTAAAGACTPPLGPTMRAVWGRLAPDRALLQRAYSLDGVAEELLFVSGPLLVGVLMRFAPPAAGIVFGTALIVVGTAGFVSSPAVRAVRPGDRKARRAAGGRRVLRGLGRPVAATAAVGLALGVVDLLVVAFTEGHGYGADSVAWILAALSTGSAVGGLLNGAVTWGVPRWCGCPCSSPDWDWPCSAPVWSRASPRWPWSSPWPGSSCPRPSPPRISSPTRQPHPRPGSRPGPGSTRPSTRGVRAVRPPRERWPGGCRPGGASRRPARSSC